MEPLEGLVRETTMNTGIINYMYLPKFTVYVHASIDDAAVMQ